MKDATSQVRGIRFPTKLWKLLKIKASENNRTIAGEILSRLTQSVAKD